MYLLQADSPELLADLQAHQLLPRLALLQPRPPLSTHDAASGANAADTDAAAAGDINNGSNGDAMAAAEAFTGVKRALERLFPATATPAAPALGLSSYWCALRATLEEQRGRAPGGAEVAADADSAGGGGGDGAVAQTAAHGAGDGGRGDGSGSGGGDAEAVGGHSHKIGPRPLAALKTLVDLAEESAARGEPLLWGWCR